MSGSLYAVETEMIAVSEEMEQKWASPLSSRSSPPVLVVLVVVVVVVAVLVAVVVVVVAVVVAVAAVVVAVVEFLIQLRDHRRFFQMLQQRY